MENARDDDAVQVVPDVDPGFLNEITLDFEDVPISPISKFSPTSPGSSQSSEWNSDYLDQFRQNFNLRELFLGCYQSLSSYGPETFDGVDSPRRLYNRRAPKNVDLKSPIKKKSKLSWEAAEFFPAASRSANSLPSSREVESPIYSQSTFDVASDGFPFSPSAATLPKSRPIMFPWALKQDPFASSFLNPPKAQRVCLYCKRTGKDPAIVVSHCLRNPITKAVICPFLIDDLCIQCGHTEDWLIHTTAECRSNAKSSFKSLFQL